MFQAPDLNLIVILPVTIVAGVGVLLMFLNLFLKEDKNYWYPWLSLAGITLALILSAGLWGRTEGAFTAVGGYPMIVLDNFASFLNLIFLLTGFITILLSINYLRRMELDRPEYYMLLLFSLSGMILMGMANDLILVFLALELLSIPLYIMAGFAVPRVESEESAMKYFLLGAFSSGIFVFGIALTYGVAGSTALPEIVDKMAGGGSLALAAIAFLLVGFAFKVAAAPFHMWTPDVYEGAPTAVTAFMSVGAKVGGFAAMLRVFMVALPEMSDAWVGAVAIIATLTLIFGNVIAITQTNIKRMLGYSSIAHAGYILIGVAASAYVPTGISAALFYMMAYLFTTLGAFAIVIALEHKLGEGVMLDDYKGLATRNPMLALAMMYFMLSLTGVPPTGGFSGKFYIFRAAVESNLIWLAIVGIVTSVISGFYYLRVVYLMYMTEGEGEKVETPMALRTALAVTIVATVVLGFIPGAWFDLARDAVIATVQVVAGG